MSQLETTMGIFGLTFLLHLFFAVGLLLSARKLKSQGERVMFAHPLVWALHTVIWGMFVVLPYWLIHHSAMRTLARNET